MRSAVVVDAIRTPSGRGKPGGALSGTTPVALLAGVLDKLVTRVGIDPSLIDDVIAGCAMQVSGQSMNIARVAALAAGLPESVPGTSVDRQCGSSQQAAHFAAQSIIAGSQDVVIACGIESMSRVPMGTSAMGYEPSSDLTHRYPEGLVNQGISAELITARWKFSRTELDEFSAESHRRAAAAAATGVFDRELVAVPVEGGEHSYDETVRPATSVENLAGLRASFWTDELAARFPEIEWVITPGNSSPLTDGASAALLMEESLARSLGLQPRARMHTMSVTGSDPLLMLTGVIPATEMALRRAGMTINDIDTYEVNEAFAPVPLAWLRDVDADPAKLNPAGGAIALGHALGSSGTRLLTTMMTNLERLDGTFGLQTMCEGGGMANATIIERLA